VADPFRCVVEYAADAFLLYDEAGCVLDVNEAACTTYGHPREGLVGLALSDLVDTGGDAADLLEVDVALCAEAPVELAGTHRRADRTTFPADVRVGTVDGPDGQRRFFALVRDVSERADSQRKLERAAESDGLTGLPSCSGFTRHLELAVERAQRRGHALAVLHVDLNRFRLINHGLGSAAGDELLRQTAWRLREAALADSVVARYSADEFLVLLPDLERDGDAFAGPIAAAEAAAARVHEALGARFEVDGTELFVDASVGMSVYPLDADGASVLMRNADVASQQAKQPGQGPSKLFAGETSDKWARLWLATRLRKAVQREELVLHFQPIVDVGSLAAAGWREGEPLAPHMVAAEALVRWQDQDGLVPPGSFIPLAEDLGLIEAIGRWVFGAVCRQADALRAHGRSLELSFNLSLREIWRRDLVEEIVARVRESTVDPSALIVEVTESSAMTDPVRTKAVLAELERHGFKLAIDDFGAGHSSLARLSQLPAQLLKIDRSFVARLEEDPGAAAMVTAMIELARNLGMRALAEGVETEAQLRFLVERGCPLAQGFLFARPVTPEELEAL